MTTTFLMKSRGIFIYMRHTHSLELDVNRENDRDKKKKYEMKKKISVKKSPSILSLRMKLLAIRGNQTIKSLSPHIDYEDLTCSIRYWWIEGGSLY